MGLKERWKKAESILKPSLSLAKAQFKLRNEGSYLGILWYLLNPILMFILLFFIFSPRIGQGIVNYPVYLIVGILMFNFFQQTTSEATRVIRNYIGIIKSTNFSRESLVLASIISLLLSHAFEILILIGFLVFTGTQLIGLLFYPIIFLFFLLFIYGFSLMLASVSVHFADLENIWAFASRLIFFVTPIFYAVEGQRRLFIINLFNPVFYFITLARDAVIYMKMPEYWIILGAVSYSLLFLIVGIFIFNRLKNKLAEYI